MNDTLPADTELPAAVLAARAADDKLATDVVVLEVGPVLAVCEHFVIVSGSNTRQVRTIADEITDQLREQRGIKPIRVEGRDDATWILLDYGERLWADVPHVPWAATTAVAGAAPSNLEGSESHP